RTTVAKAKELRSFVEPLITKAKTDSVASRRFVATQIHDRSILKELFNDIVAKIGDRPGGYTRIVKVGQRKGDAAELAFIELVDYSGIVKPKAPKKAKEEETPKSDEAKAEAAEQKKEEKKVKEKKPKTPKPKKSDDVKVKKAPAKAKTTTTRKTSKDK
ncbi:MAG: 50S ribosomal protein L17, partial [Ignavibacteria bacterium]|nr:50S ribosomal protein L17 [Ignavibacteria bacterium]